MHDDRSPFGALERRLGAAVDECGKLLGTVLPWPPCLRSVIDPPRCARRHTALLDGGHPERRNDSLCAGAIVARMDDTHNSWCVPNNTSAMHRLRCLPCTWQTVPSPTLLVKSELLNFQEHRSALLHTMASVSLAFQCRL